MSDVAALNEAEELLAEVDSDRRRFPRYPTYRESDSKWLLDIPAHWGIRRLRFVAAINPTKSEIAGLLADDLVSFVPMEAVNEFGGVQLDQTRPLETVTQGYTYFRNGDIVIAKITPCFENGKGSIADQLVNGIGFGTTELHVVRPIPSKLDRQYLFYVTMSQQFRSLGTGEMYGAGGQKRVPDSFIKDFRTPLPPLDEQRAIARFLDRETAKIDSLVAKKRRLIELLQEKRTALISRAVTKGLTPDAPMKPSGIDWLGDVPAHWHFHKLGFMVRMRGGATPSKSNDAYWKGTIPWVSPKDMKTREIADTEDHISDAALAETSLTLFEPPVVLMVVRGMILAHTFPVAITTTPVTVNQDIKALIPTIGCSEEYLLNLLTGLSQVILGTVDDSAHGTKVLRLPVWKHVGVYLPDETEQAAICEYVRTTLDQFDGLIRKVENAISRLIEYRSALISAAVTGQIDVRAAASEEAAA